MSSTVREAAAPYARHLSEVTRLTVNVAVLEGVDVVYLDKIAARDLRIPDSRQGGRGEAHATALGKAICATLPEDPIPVGVKRELDPDDRIYVGAWTRVVIREATEDEIATLA